MYGNGSYDGVHGTGQPNEPPECAAVAARLDAYHDGLLPAEDAHAMASHVAGCARCAARLDALAAADQLIRSAPAPRVGPELRQRLYGRIAATLGAPLPSAPIRSISETMMNETRPNRPRAATTHHHSPRRLSVWLSGIAAALIVALLAGVFLTQGREPKHGGSTVGSSNTPETAGTCAPGTIRANLPAHAYLTDLAMTSATDGWAVGAIQNRDSSWAQSLILHYSHCQWTQAGPVIPNVALESISMDSATDGWIVGGGAGAGNVALHYTGGQWQQVQIAGQNSTSGYFQVVRMFSPTDGWMITSTKNAQGVLSTSLAHDSNGTWSLVNNAPLSYINDVAPVGPDDAWVIGTVSDSNTAGMLMRYQGGHWVATFSLGSYVDVSHLSLRMSSPTDGWAMAEVPGPGGNDFEGVEKALVLHYDGNTWKPVNTGANPAAQRVRIFGDGEAWAFALTNHPSTANPGNLTVTLSQYESGGTWQAERMPANDISDIAGLSRASAGEYWAIGYIETTQPNLNDSSGNSWMGAYSFVLLHFVNGTWMQYGR